MRVNGILRGLIVALGVLALAPAAKAYQFEIKTPIRDQARVQRAISFQVNRQVSKHWALDPVSFAPGGIPITIDTVSQLAIDCLDDNVDGCHTWDGQHAEIYVDNGDWQDETLTISHEVIETELDMRMDRYINGHLVEAADPAAGEYTRFGVTLSNYVFPRYYYGVPAHGPRDQLRLTSGPYPAGL